MASWVDLRLLARKKSQEHEPAEEAAREEAATPRRNSFQLTNKGMAARVMPCSPLACSMKRPCTSRSQRARV
ncbi:hypothetical protein KSB_85230 [Ktedonobacter robiniae]|uniref:Uncharacterized protein n=1 Tax=Ktedonobacter robiniae TaxID=2778365 RepID=A0ABQ3V549_9CHLR|nr:hypothetical protein KSB_85230 [Ktedonobacter robiniae]